MKDDCLRVHMEESKNRSSIYSNKRQFDDRANNFMNSGNKVAGSDNDCKLTRESVTSYGSGNIRTNTSSGSRWKRDKNLKEPIENLNRKIALSHIEKSETYETTSLGNFYLIKYFLTITNIKHSTTSIR